MPNRDSTAGNTMTYGNCAVRPVDVRAVVIFNTGIFEHDTEAQHRAGLTKEAMKSKIKSALEADATRDGFGHVRHVHLIYEHRPVEHDLRL